VVWQSIGQRYGLRTFGSRRGNILVHIELARTRPGELKAAKTPAVESDGKKKYPSSTRAHPPITKAEMVAAQVSICRWHHGLPKPI
jgi:hypothetical protein